MEKSLFIAGDSHGNLRKILSWNKQVSNSVLVHLGDFGVDSRYLFNLANELAEQGNDLRIYRGNHETVRFSGQTYGDKENLTLLSDYSVIEVEGKRILGIGGGISIDRNIRKQFALKNPGQCNYYFDDEFFNLDEERLREFQDIDILITHTAPNYLIPNLSPSFVAGFAKDDDKLLEDLEKERQETKRAVEILAANNRFEWFFGHFHQHVIGEFQGINYRCLDIDEIYEYVNT